MVRNCCGGKNIGDGADVGRKRMAWWMGRGMWDVPTRPRAEPGQWKEIVWAYHRGGVGGALLVLTIC